MSYYPFEPYKIDGHFGDEKSYGLHEGVDLNGLGGGNTDLGTPLRAVADGEIIHASEATTGFGNMPILKIQGEFGVRFCRYAHCDKILVRSGFVKQGDVIATMGSTGNSTAAHLHFAIIKKALTNWRTYAKTKTQLDEYFEDPIPFLKNLKISTPVQNDKDWERQNIIDSYFILTGKYPSEETVKWRLSQHKNLAELISDICLNDGDFKNTWVNPEVNQTISRLLTQIENETVLDSQEWESRGIKKQVESVIFAFEQKCQSKLESAKEQWELEHEESDTNTNLPETPTTETDTSTNETNQSGSLIEQFLNALKDIFKKK